MTTQPSRQPYRYRRVEAVEPEWRRFPGWRLHCGVDMDDRAVLDAASFLMKGSRVPADSRWGGDPAIEIKTGGSE
jgi:hypothetical protein